ncbi:hypothetical protein BDV11DRAFT_173615 [Aspergillus similis]
MPPSSQPSQGLTSNAASADVEDEQLELVYSLLRACASYAPAKCNCMVTDAGGSCARWANPLTLQETNTGNKNRCRRLKQESHSMRRTQRNHMLRSVAAKTAQKRLLDELNSLVQAGHDRPTLITPRTMYIPTPALQQRSRRTIRFSGAA